MKPETKLYAAHREKMLERLRQQRMAAVVFTHSPKTRNHDCEYRFRPNSDFWYLCGFAEPGAVLLLLPDRPAGESVLYLRPRVKEEETWTGLRLGVERAVEHLGVNEARPLGQLWNDLPDLLKGYESILYRVGEDEARDRQMLEVSSKLRAGARNGVVAPMQWVDPLPSLHELRLFKSEAEVALIKRAAGVTAEAHLAAMREAKPGKNEREIDALIVSTFMRSGGREAYNNIVAGGANACILHYNDNNAPLVDGELLLIDAGCELDCYASDVTRTFPINGRFSAEQKALYELVLAAEKKAIEAVRPGVSFHSLHDIATRTLAQGLIDLKLLKGSLTEVLESKSYIRFYMHKTGHWLGLDVHDCGTYFEQGKSRLLAPGMITTVEPGLYIAPDDMEVEKRWRGIGVRIEDDILVTPEGHQNLTYKIPKEVEDVEAACAGRSLAMRR